MDLLRLARRIASPPLVYYSGPGSSSEYYQAFKHHGVNVGVFYTPKKFYNYSDHHDMEYNPIPVDQFKSDFENRAHTYSEEDVDLMRHVLSNLKSNAVNFWCYDHVDYNKGPEWVMHDCFHNYVMNRPGMHLWGRLMNGDQYRAAFFADYGIDTSSFTKAFGDYGNLADERIDSYLLNWNSASNYFDQIILMLPENLKDLGAGIKHSANKSTLRDYFPDILPIFFNPASDGIPITLDYRPLIVYKDMDGRYRFVSEDSARRTPDMASRYLDLKPSGMRETERLFRETVAGVRAFFDEFLKSNVGNVVLASA